MLELYKNIKLKRKELKMSQEELANKVGYKDRSSIAKIESGEVDLPQSKIVEFAKVLQTTPGALMGWDNETVGKDYANAPKLNDNDEKDIARTMEKLKEQLMNEQGLMFDGELLDEETVKLVLEEVERQERLIKTINKKYIPKKYRK